MIYLLDADTLIRADALYYPPKRFPTFWPWLAHQGAEGQIKIPSEQYEEITAGKGELVDWLKEPEVKVALLFDEEADTGLVSTVTLKGYADDLTDLELEKIGKDPFLIAAALADPRGRCVVSFETSAPSKQRANRKMPDVCSTFGVTCKNLFQLINDLDFTTDWKP